MCHRLSLRVPGTSPPSRTTCVTWDLPPSRTMCHRLPFFTFPVPSALFYIPGPIGSNSGLFHRVLLRIQHAPSHRLFPDAGAISFPDVGAIGSLYTSSLKSGHPLQVRCLSGIAIGNRPLLRSIGSVDVGRPASPADANGPVGTSRHPSVVPTESEIPGLPESQYAPRCVLLRPPLCELSIARVIRPSGAIGVFRIRHILVLSEQAAASHPRTLPKACIRPARDGSARTHVPDELDPLHFISALEMVILDGSGTQIPAYPPCLNSASLRSKRVISGQYRPYSVSSHAPLWIHNNPADYRGAHNGFCQNLPFWGVRMASIWRQIRPIPAYFHPSDTPLRTPTPGNLNLYPETKSGRIEQI